MIKKIFKWVGLCFAAIIALSIVIGGCSGDSDTNTKSSSVKQETKKEVQYVECDPSQMLSELEKNALKASKKYKGKDVVLVGIMSNVDSDGKYFSIEPLDRSSFITGFHITINNKEQREKVTEIDKGTKIVVKGHISDVGEIAGYYVDLHDVNIAK